MRNSAVNCVLTAVALCDIGTMVTYLVYILHFVFMRQSTCSPTFTHGWMQFLQWHVMISITLHTTSLWLAVAMAFIRRMTLRLCIVIFICVTLMCTPNMFVHEIAVYEGAVWEPSTQCAMHFPPNYTQLIYTFTASQCFQLQGLKEATANNCSIFKLNIWMIGLVFKVIPCILLMFFSVGLVNKIRQAENNRRKLTNVSLNNLNSTDAGAMSAKKIKGKVSENYNRPEDKLELNAEMTSGKELFLCRKSHKSDRTTAMLVVILAVFLITELPQGVISILCAIFTADVHKYLYFHLGDILDLLSLLNSSVNFVLYCLMSSRYRQTFWLVFLPAGAHPSKEYAPLATEAEEQRDDCMSGAGSDDSRERVEQL
ncbi:unnamed protein product [Nippostrongylus brasiliensis]|uniref:G_PROTEIN_RECEP_F1_2 domain-containing protein n=1 Tax=Nippostrongylus brasiliensis TaxID=27835 RepID=A0A0N4YAM3_NIPBR|nr:unnamed protein product [Nippostrongylus brasiliensis]